MTVSPQMLREHALAIWQAGVDAVASERLVANAVRCDGGTLTICGETISLADVGRIVVVGAGKAGAGMAAAFESAVPAGIREEKLTGWVNVPADCVRTLEKIHLHAARPAGVNEPTEEGVLGAEKILELVENLTERDVCIVLISGGGSALLPAPAPGISLADKQAVTRMLMHSGATISELNCVRKQLSRIKGGGLANAAIKGRVFSLMISDVIGDPLDVIASGPTVPNSTTAADALAVLQKFDREKTKAPEAVWNFFEQQADQKTSDEFPHDRVFNQIIGNNAVAVAAAAAHANSLGYHVVSLGSDNADEARAVGQSFLEHATNLRDNPESQLPVCILSGGEPVVHLAATDQPRKGGRNQEVALAALAKDWPSDWQGTVLISGGTDGEDGPTDAAGAIADQLVQTSALEQNLTPDPFLAINNSYPFFEQTGGLIKTGPTHTNVMDLRVMLLAERRP